MILSFLSLACLALAQVQLPSPVSSVDLSLVKGGTEGLFIELWQADIGISLESTESIQPGDYFNLLFEGSSLMPQDYDFDIVDSSGTVIFHVANSDQQWDLIATASDYFQDSTSGLEGSFLVEFIADATEDLVLDVSVNGVQGSATLFSVSEFEATPSNLGYTLIPVARFGIYFPIATEQTYTVEISTSEGLSFQGDFSEYALNVISSESGFVEGLNSGAVVESESLLRTATFGPYSQEELLANFVLTITITAGIETVSEYCIYYSINGAEAESICTPTGKGVLGAPGGSGLVNVVEESVTSSAVTSAETTSAETSVETTDINETTTVAQTTVITVDAQTTAETTVPETSSGVVQTSAVQTSAETSIETSAIESSIETTVPETSAETSPSETSSGAVETSAETSAETTGAVTSVQTSPVETYPVETSAVETSVETSAPETSVESTVIATSVPVSSAAETSAPESSAVETTAPESSVVAESTTAQTSAPESTDVKSSSVESTAAPEAASATSLEVSTSAESSAEATFASTPSNASITVAPSTVSSPYELNSTVTVLESTTITTTQTVTYCKHQTCGHTAVTLTTIVPIVHTVTTCPTVIEGVTVTVVVPCEIEPVTTTETAWNKTHIFPTATDVTVTEIVHPTVTEIVHPDITSDVHLTTETLVEEDSTLTLTRTVIGTIILDTGTTATPRANETVFQATNSVTLHQANSGVTIKATALLLLSFVVMMV